MFFKRPLLFVPLLFCLSLVIGCSGGDETAAPAGGDAGGAADQTTNDAGQPANETGQPAGNNNEQPGNNTNEPVPQTTGQQPSQPSTGASLDLSYVTSDFTSAIVIHPARVLNSKFVSQLIDAGLPLDKELEKPTQELGLDPRQIEQVMVLLDNETASMIPQMMQSVVQPAPARPAFDVIEGPVETEEAVPEKEEEAVPEKRDQGALDSPPAALQPVVFQDQPATEAFPADGAAFEEGHGPGPGMGVPPLPTLIIRFTEPIDTDKLFSNPNIPPMEDAVVDGLNVKKIPMTPSGVIHIANPQTMIVTKSEYLKKMVDTKSAESELISELKQIDANNDRIVVADLIPFRPQLAQAGMMMAFFIPPDKSVLATLPTKTKTLTITAGISAPSLLSLSFLMDSPEDVTAVNTVLTDGLQQFRQVYDQRKAEGVPPNVKLSAAEQQQLIQMSDEIVQGISNKADGNRLTVSIPKPGNFDKLIDILKPAIEEAKKAAEQSVKKNNLKQIGLAFHNYHDVYQAFPGAGSNGPGNRMGLSWRVHILPFIDQAPLYQQFNMDEPWDSETNKALIAQMPEIYKTDGVEDPTKTSLHVFVGDQEFSLDKGKAIREFTDGTSNSLLVVEAAPDKAEVWTKPGGLTLNEKDPLASLGKYSKDSFLALFADGFVRSISTMIDPDTLKALITINGGEVVGEF